MEDSKIIDLYFQRNEEAISQTAAKYGSYCFSIAHSILANCEDAKEAVNDTYLGAWNAIPPHVPACFSGFLGKITRRISITRYLAARTDKRGGREPELILEELAGCIPSPIGLEQMVEGRELERLLGRFVRELPDTERRVFVLRYWHCLSIREIGQRFGFTPAKVKSMLHRIRSKLKEQLNKEGIAL